MTSLQKGQLYRQMLQPSMNSKLFSKKNYIFDWKFLSSNNFKKKPSCASIKGSVSWISKGKLLEHRSKKKRTLMPSYKLPASNNHLEFLLKCSLFLWINGRLLLWSHTLPWFHRKPSLSRTNNMKMFALLFILKTALKKVCHHMARLLERDSYKN